VHIVVVTAYYPTPEQVFSGTFVREQVRALARAHQVTVIRPVPKKTSQIFAPDPPPEQEETWTVYRPRFVNPLQNWFLMLLSYLYSLFACSRQIDWSTVDVVHAHVAYPSGFAATWLARYYRKPFVLTEHAGNFRRWINLSLYRRVLVHWTIKKARYVLPVSQALRRNMEREGILGYFAVVPNVINTDLFCPLDASPHQYQTGDTLRLLWIGGSVPLYIERKGGPELLQAIALARPRLKQPLRLSLVVSGGARAMCETLALRLGVFDCCEFLGTLSNQEVRDQMQQHDALVLASHSESFGVVLIEAMACGKPVIATRCGGPSEVVTPETGILIPPGDIAALADAIVQMAETLAQYDPAHLVTYAHEWFGPEAVLRSLNEVYAMACSPSNGTGNGTENTTSNETSRWKQ
jgi:glycosyltransferase involved in cell wall biosynthesis